MEIVGVLLFILLILVIRTSKRESIRKYELEVAEREKVKVSRKSELEAIQKSELEAIRISELEAIRIAELEVEEALEIERLKVREALEIERLKVRDARAIEEESLKLRLAPLTANLPFYPSKKTPSTELAEHDKNMWEDVTRLVKNEDSEKTTLYFVKLRSLMDDQEYFKIGITTKGVVMRFKKSTQLELLEIIKVFDTEKWKAAFLEYHFLREFRLYDGLSTSIGEQRPDVGFSGYTEVVRSNSINKISEYFEELNVYNKMR
jgi:hypothetical protein